MNTPNPDLLALEEALKKSKIWMEAAAKITDGTEFESNARSRLCATLSHLSIEHHQAIHTLVENHVWGSALALFRPQLEAYVRAMWYLKCATDAQVEGFYRDEEPPRFREMAEQIDKHLANKQLTRIHAASWRQLCGFTHGGIPHLAGRLTADEVKVNYDLKEIEKFVTCSTVLSIASTAIIGRLAKSEAVLDQTEKLQDELFPPREKTEEPGNSTAQSPS